jgi:DNA-binding MarR family transcriptional regulator
MERVAEVQNNQIAKVAEGLRSALLTLEEIAGPPPCCGTTTRIAPRVFFPASAPPTDTVSFAQQLFSERRKREKHFEADHFGEPQWDIMLDLFIAEKGGNRISVSSACIGACVPPTTALRHIVWLTEQGHLERIPDENDSRRVYIKLSADMMERMERYLAETMAGRR